MFEDQQTEIEPLMKSNTEFRTLYNRHKDLDNKARDADLGAQIGDSCFGLALGGHRQAQLGVVKIERRRV